MLCIILKSLKNIWGIEWQSKLKWGLFWKLWIREIHFGPPKSCHVAPHLSEMGLSLLFCWDKSEAIKDKWIVRR